MVAVVERAVGGREGQVVMPLLVPHLLSDMAVAVAVARSTPLARLVLQGGYG